VALVRLIIAIVVIVFIVVVNLIKAASSAKSQGGPRVQPRKPPGGGQTPADDIRGFLSALGIQTEEPQKPQAPPAQPTQAQPAEQGETVYEADDTEVKSYLQSIGVQVESKPARPQRPKAEPQRRPAAGPARRRPQPPQEPRPAEAIVVEAVPVAEAVAETPRKARVAPRKRRRATRAEPVAAAPKRLQAKSTPAQAAPQPAMNLGRLGPLGAAPTIAELRRAVILSEVIRRPDFSRLPYDRLNS